MINFNLVSLLLQLHFAISFQGSPVTTLTVPSFSIRQQRKLVVSVRNEHKVVSTTTDESIKSCYWRHPTSGAWEPRIDFRHLDVGQKLTGVLVQELLDAKTGPKVWFDCGIGKVVRGNWTIVTAMHRIRERKESVAVKKVARFRKKNDGVDLWVSRVFPDNGRVEVVTRQEEVPARAPELISVGDLKMKQELTGVVSRVESYGVLVNVGANRLGLLHIRKVAELLGSYVAKNEGLISAGLEKGAKIRVVVDSIEKKRLFLDFPEDVKANAKNERAEKTAEMRDASNPESVETSRLLSEDEVADWIKFATEDAAIGALDTSSQTSASDSYDEDHDVDDDDELYDDEDEDRSIEDALGIGMY